MSIDVRELMVGNWIDCGNGGYARVFEITKTEDGEAVIALNKDGIVCASAPTIIYNGIPLSSELLSKIEGFKENRIQISVAPNRWLSYAYDDRWEIENSDCETMLELKISALHQLQNTFFCLSGNELKLNFSKQ